MDTKQIVDAGNHMEREAAHLQEQTDATRRLAQEMRQMAFYAQELPARVQAEVLAKWQASHVCGDASCLLNTLKV